MPASVGQSQNIRVVGNDVYLTSPASDRELAQRRRRGQQRPREHRRHPRLRAARHVPLRRQQRHDRAQQHHRQQQPARCRQRDRLPCAMPPGTGVMVLASQNTEVTGNTITNHLDDGHPRDQLPVDADRLRPGHLRPTCGLYAHANSIADFGASPGAFVDPPLNAIVSGLPSSAGARPAAAEVPAAIWDGIVDPATGSGRGPQARRHLQRQSARSARRATPPHAQHRRRDLLREHGTRRPFRAARRHLRRAGSSPSRRAWTARSRCRATGQP